MIKTPDEIFNDVSFEIERINSVLANSKIVGILQINSFPVFYENSNSELKGIKLIQDYLKESLNNEESQKYIFHDIEKEYSSIKLHQVIPSGLDYIFKISCDSILKSIPSINTDNDVCNTYLSILDCVQYNIDSKDKDIVETQKVSYLILGVMGMGYLIVLFDNLDRYFFDNTEMHISDSSGDSVQILSKNDCLDMVKLLKNPNIPTTYTDITGISDKKDDNIAIDYINDIISKYHKNNCDLMLYKELERIMDNDKNLSKILNILFYKNNKK